MRADGGADPSDGVIAVTRINGHEVVLALFAPGGTGVPIHH